MAIFQTLLVLHFFGLVIRLGMSVTIMVQATMVGKCCRKRVGLL